jgi:hypothetical protein
MHDEHGVDVEVGTLNEQTCSPDVATWIMGQLKQEFSGLDLPHAARITHDRVFPGDRSKTVHRNGDVDSGYPGFGTKFNTFQVEFARWLRQQHREEIAQVVAAVAESFASAFRAV